LSVVSYENEQENISNNIIKELNAKLEKLSEKHQDIKFDEECTKNIIYHKLWNITNNRLLIKKSKMLQNNQK